MNSSVKQPLAGKKVFVGLSGGVDSAATCALLLEQGASVTGVFIKGWYPPGLPCTWAEDRRDAMRVAAHLHIPFYTLDASEAYKKWVIDYLIAEYRAGRTPNPDIMCNREVKFGAFFNFAMKQGADFIATGHYARAIRTGEDAELHRGVDDAKDQSYFLWDIRKQALERTLFPLGELRKEKVRSIAKKLGLPVAQKADSQGICFLGSISVDDFLRAELGVSPGTVLREDGTEIGAHDGAVLYTLGQRISVESSEPGPWYVVRKDVAANTVTVSHSLNSFSTKGITLSNENWFSEPKSGRIHAQYRYHGPLVSGTYDNASHAFIPHESLTETPAQGQSLVLYDGTHCLGGGIIASL